jgi:hypothetical protein
MAIPVQQAAVKALAEYLRGRLDDDVEVSDGWPNPDEPLPEKAISILLAGKRQDMMADAEVVTHETLGSIHVYTWLVKTVDQDIQLDVWASYKSHRDELLAALDDALNRGTATTLGEVFGSVTRDGPLLQLQEEDGHDGYVDFTFDGPDLIDTPLSVHRNEYRATIAGKLSTTLTIKSQHPALQVAGLRIRYGETVAAHTAENIDIPVEE